MRAVYGFIFFVLFTFGRDKGDRYLTGVLEEQFLYIRRIVFTPPAYNDKYPVIFLSPSSPTRRLVSGVCVCVCVPACRIYIQPVTVRRIVPTGMILITNVYIYHPYTHMHTQICIYSRVLYTCMRVCVPGKITHQFLCVCVCSGKRFLDGCFYRARADNDGRRTDNAMTLHTHAHTCTSSDGGQGFKYIQRYAYVCMCLRAHVYGRIVIAGREGGLMYI